MLQPCVPNRFTSYTSWLKVTLPAHRNAFGVVIPQARIDDTEAILRAITPEELEKKRVSGLSKLTCASECCLFSQNTS